MAAEVDRVIVVMGATGLQGGAVARHLLADGWKVRAVTRKPEGENARVLRALGAEVVQADMEDPATLTPVFAGAYGAYSVQNTLTAGVEKEIRQGKNVADAAKAAAVRHVVYSSAGNGAAGSGVPSWESKLVIEAYMRSLDLPLTVLRPMAFMELMTEKKFFPQVSTWNVMGKVMGGGRPVPWLSAADLGEIAAKAFAEPERYIGKNIALASDVLTLDECRALYREALGKTPARSPMPVWLFRRFGIVGQDLTAMWGWLRANQIDLDTAPARAIHPEALTVRAWLERQKGEG